MVVLYFVKREHHVPLLTFPSQIWKLSIIELHTNQGLEASPWT